MNELHDALLSLGILPENIALRKDRDTGSQEIAGWFQDLMKAGRAFRLGEDGIGATWVATEGLTMYAAAFPNSGLEAQLPTSLKQNVELSQEEATHYLVRGWSEALGPFTVEEISKTLGLALSAVNIALAQMENEGVVLRGSFRPGAGQEEFCDRRILARIHRSTIGRLRREIEPVSQASFVRFLFRWQHVDSASRASGEGGLLDVIEMLQGYEAAAGAIEPELLSCRVMDYKPFLLDRLCIGGEVVWGRMSRNSAKNYANGNGASHRTAPLSRVTPITLALRESLDWLLDQLPDAGSGQPGAAAETLDVLSRRGACFISDIVAATRRLPSDVEETLWLLAADGRVTSDSLEGLRMRINGRPNRGRRVSRRKRARPYRRGGFSRWSRLEPVDPDPEAAEAKAHQLLLRYGVVFPELLVREPMAPNWRELVRVFRRLEARGEIRGGRFVAGFVGEQFAMPEAVELLRAVNKDQSRGHMEVVSACDPLNVVGILTPGERVPAMLGNKAVFRDGVPVASLENGKVVDRSGGDQAVLAQAYALLRRSPVETQPIASQVAVTAP